MSRARRAAVPELFADPFGEHQAPLVRGPLQLLGARFRFESNSQALLGLVDSAYAATPAHRLGARAPQVRIGLVLTSGHRRHRRDEPPALGGFCGAGIVGGATAASDLVAISPRDRSALVAVSPRMLRYPYHTRYELLEFAVYTLAARTQGLVPLHSACIGHGGHGVLLLGDSGSGKSTVALHCLLNGLDFLAEDSVLVEPRSLRATGVANFLHLRADSLHWLTRKSDLARVRRSPVIRRRSGARKFELDLRQGGYRLAPAPLKIIATVFLSAQRSGDRPRLQGLPRAELLRRITALQPFAAHQPGWSAFRASLARTDAFELGRGSHPLQTVAILRTLLGAAPMQPAGR